MLVMVNGLKEITSTNDFTRKQIQEKISNPNNEIWSATGKIEFNKENGIRLLESAHLVQLCENNGKYEFLSLIRNNGTNKSELPCPQQDDADNKDKKTH